MSTSKRVNKSLKDKYESVMHFIAKRKSRKAICIELGVPASTICGWMKDKDVIISQYQLEHSDE